MNNAELRRLVDPEGEERAERQIGAREGEWTDMIAEGTREKIGEVLFGISRVWDGVINDLGKGDKVHGEERLRIEARSNCDLANLVAIKEFADNIRADRKARYERQEAIRNAAKKMEDEKRRGVSGAVSDQSA